MKDPFVTGWDPAQVAVMTALRDWAVSFGELNQLMSAWTGLPTSDASALRHIVWAAQDGEPLSPALLARRIGMTTAAVSVLLDRLERAELVVRVRDQTDRRRVALHPTDEAVTRAQEFMSAAGVEIAATLRSAEPGDLEAATEVLVRMTRSVTEAGVRLRKAPRPGDHDVRRGDPPA